MAVRNLADNVDAVFVVTEVVVVVAVDVDPVEDMVIPDLVRIDDIG